MKRVVIITLLALLLVGCASYNLESGPPLVVDTGVDPDSWALIPGGEFLMGQFNEEVNVDYDYQIMITPVTNQQFAAYLNEALESGYIKMEGDEIVGYYPGDEFREYRHELEIAAGDWLHFLIGAEGSRIEFDGSTFTVLPGYENHPAVDVTWFGAKGYCEYYGWRLPTEIEWEKAARGTDGRAYPWGDEISVEYANYYASRDPFEEFAGKIGDTTPVGFYNGSIYAGFETFNAVSPYGLYDVAGNVEQWMADVYEFQHYRYLRGGSKAFYGYNLRVWTRNNASPYYFSPNIGFRCAQDG